MKVLMNRKTKRLGESQFGEDSEVLLRNIESCGLDKNDYEVIDFSEKAYKRAIEIQNESEGFLSSEQNAMIQIKIKEMAIAELKKEQKWE